MSEVCCARSDTPCGFQRGSPRRDIVYVWITKKLSDNTLSNSMYVLQLFWCDWIHCTKRHEVTALQHQDILRTLNSMEKNKGGESGRRRQRRQRSLWEDGCKHMPNSISGSLFLIPSLIHRRIWGRTQPARAGPLNRVGGHPRSASDGPGRLPAEEWQA